MELYLHIGTEKTGTTSVQEFMRSNRDVLKEAGVLYPYAPGFANQTALAMAGHTEAAGGLAKLFGIRTMADLIAFREKLTAELREELDKAACPKVVMSNEHCSSRLLTDEAVQTLHDLLAPHFKRIRILVYIRRQDDFVVSTYSTAIKTGGIERLSPPNEKSIQTRYDYWELLSRWARIFGRENMVVRKYDRATLVAGNIVDDFLDMCGIDAGLAYDRPEDYNESLDAEAIEFLRLANKHAPPAHVRDENSEQPEVSRRRKFIRALGAVSRGPHIDLPAEEQAKLMNAVRESNRRVAVEYFGGEVKASDDPLFAPRYVRERTSEQKLPAVRAVEFGLSLWNFNVQPLDRSVKRRQHLEQARLEGRPVPRRHGAKRKEKRERGGEVAPEPVRAAPQEAEQKAEKKPDKKNELAAPAGTYSFFTDAK